VKKLIIITLCLQLGSMSVLQGGIMLEMMKVFNLVEHFMEHQHENDRMSILDFFHIHYSGEHARDHDFDKDLSLPFKSATAGFFAHVFFPTSGIQLFESNAMDTSEKNWSTLSLGKPSSAFISFFQPPKLG
jgi:hypothetical protein